MKNWYAIYTKPRSEKKVAELLLKKELEHYLPLIKNMRQWSDRKRLVEAPLFPSYIFVHIDDKEYYFVREINGFVKFITFDNKLVTVPEWQIEAIRRYVKTGEEIIVDEENYTVGKLVRVTRGGMKGLHGRLVEVLGKQRVKVEIESIQQCLFLTIPLGSLEIIGDDSDEKVKYW